MADDGHENGTSNHVVPEIELIIKVSFQTRRKKRQLRMCANFSLSVSLSFFLVVH